MTFDLIGRGGRCRAVDKHRGSGPHTRNHKGYGRQAWPLPILVGRHANEGSV